MENASPALSADAALLLDTLRSSFNAPVAFTRLWETLKQRADHPKIARAKELLAELVKAGQVRRAGKGKRLFYWLPALEPHAHERMCAALADGPRTKSGLKEVLPGLLPGWPLAQREAMLKQLVQAGRVYQWPPLKGKANLFSLQPPNPQTYLQKPIQELAGKIQRLAGQFATSGITYAEVYALASELWQQALPAAAVAPLLKPEPQVELNTPASSPSNEQLILAGLQQFNSSALVSLTELRRSLAAVIPDKNAFDQAILKLAQQDQFALHQHDFPGGMSQVERDELVSDERGSYFIGIARIQ